jgi:phosphopantothenoylcysteine decarboxylase/phosphopantothenate--cysteine ligase
MAKILITSGPTRQYLDPVRYLSNASSGQMGASLAAAALELGHEVVIVSGPVQISYPTEAEIIPVVSTEEMLEASLAIFPDCEGMIGAAAPCDFQPATVATEKIRKSGKHWTLTLTETPDVIGTLAGQKKVGQWMVGFALETSDGITRAREKMRRKSLDLIILNGVSAIQSNFNYVQLIDHSDAAPCSFEGEKILVARQLLGEIERRFIGKK